MEKSNRKCSIRFLKPPGNFLSRVHGIFYPQNLHAVTGFSKRLFEMLEDTTFDPFSDTSKLTRRH